MNSGVEKKAWRVFLDCKQCHGGDDYTVQAANTGEAKRLARQLALDLEWKVYWVSDIGNAVQVEGRCDDCQNGFGEW